MVFTTCRSVYGYCSPFGTACLLVYTAYRKYKKLQLAQLQLSGAQLHQLRGCIKAGLTRIYVFLIELAAVCGYRVVFL